MLKDYIAISPSFFKNYFKSEAHAKWQKEGLIRDLEAAIKELNKLHKELKQELK